MSTPPSPQEACADTTAIMSAQANNPSDEFNEGDITDISMLWPTCKVIRGTPRHPGSNGSVEKMNREIASKLGKSTKTSGCKKGK
eukprot:scaffold5184_cov39-Cyclotella_meneghiniana.AAC.6